MSSDVHSSDSEYDLSIDESEVDNLLDDDDDDAFQRDLLGGNSKQESPSKSPSKKKTKKPSKTNTKKPAKLTPEEKKKAKKRYKKLQALCKKNRKKCELTLHRILRLKEQKKYNLPYVKEDAALLMEFLEKCQKPHVKIRNATIENKKCLRERILNADSRKLADTLVAVTNQTWFLVLFFGTLGLLTLILLVLLYCYFCKGEGKGSHGGGHHGGGDHKSKKTSGKKSKKTGKSNRSKKGSAKSKKK